MKKNIFKIQLLAYICFIVVTTIVIRSEIKAEGIDGRFQLMPFWSYMEAVNGRNELFVEILLNYLFFVPLGSFAFLTYGKERGLKVVWIGLALSVFVEVSQLLLKRGLFEFDDIIGNTVGCLIGALLTKNILIKLKKNGEVLWH